MTPLAQFMQDALYGADGYYSTGHARTGIRGDYFTAPETGEAFGQLLAAIFQQWQKRLNVDPFHVIEAGAGEGKLAEQICRGARLCVQPMQYMVLERSATRRGKIKQSQSVIEIYSDFSEMVRAHSRAPLQGVLFANELLDAFPVHRVRMKNGKLEEGYVGAHGCAPAIQWSSPSTSRLAAYFDRLKIALPEGYETEVNLQMADWLRDASAVLQRGLIVLIDYGRPAWDYYAEERSGGTLRGFKNHRVLGLPELLAEGSQADWTADVDFTSLALDAKEAGLEPLAFMEMGTFLKRGATVPTPGMRYLLHPEGLGTQFHVLILGKNVDPKEWIFEHNRMARLGLGV